MYKENCIYKLNAPQCCFSLSWDGGGGGEVKAFMIYKSFITLKRDQRFDEQGSLRSSH